MRVCDSRVEQGRRTEQRDLPLSDSVGGDLVNAVLLDHVVLRHFELPRAHDRRATQKGGHEAHAPMRVE